MTQKQILVVDDEACMRKLLGTNLKACGYVVSSAADGAEALRMIDAHPFDLVLLDLNMPGANGLLVVEAVRRSAEMPIMIVSGRSRQSDKVEALHLGADDYMVKPFGIPELLARVEALLRRVTPGPIGPAPSYRYRGLEVDFGARRARMYGLDVPLTRREFEVLAYFAHNAGKTLLHRQVLQAVWGGCYRDEADYVYGYVQRIRRKIEPNRQTPQYLLTERCGGYRMPLPTSD